jgi:hypothetical protein
MPQFRFKLSDYEVNLAHKSSQTRHNLQSLRIKSLIAMSGPVTPRATQNTKRSKNKPPTKKIEDKSPSHRIIHTSPFFRQSVLANQRANELVDETVLANKKLNDLIERAAFNITFQLTPICCMLDHFTNTEGILVGDYAYKELLETLRRFSAAAVKFIEKHEKANKNKSKRNAWITRPTCT